MKDLASTLAEKERSEKDRFGEVWDRLSSGTLSDEEAAELEALATASPQARDAYEAFRPLGEEFQARMVRTLEARTPAGEAAQEAEPARVLPFRRRRLVRLGGWVSAAAAAAALVVVLIRPPEGAAPWPEYVVSLEGGVSELRSQDAVGPEPLFVPGSFFELVLRPLDAVPGEVETRLFLARGEGEPLPWDGPAEISPAGAVRVAGEIGLDLEIGPGAWTLWVAVGRPGRLPSSAGDLNAGDPNAGPDDRDAVLVQVRFRIGTESP